MGENALSHKRLLVGSVCVCMCMCVWERERQTEIISSINIDTILCPSSVFLNIKWVWTASFRGLVWLSKGFNRWEIFRYYEHTKIYVIIWMSVKVFYHIVLSIYRSGKEFSCQCRRCKRSRFNPCARKICWSRKWQPTPVFFPGKFHGPKSL